MKLDNEQQREVLIKIINSTQFRGDSVEYIVDLKQKIQEAEVEE